MQYYVAIVGGGAAGLSCALTLASSKGRGWQWIEDKKFVVFDTGSSDLNKAYLRNVPGVDATLGKELISKIRKQIQEFDSVDFVEERVRRIEKEGDVYRLWTESGKEFTATYVVLATGFHSFDIEGLPVEIVENPKSPKPGRIMIKHVDYEVMPNLFVVGTLAGLSSHFTSCAGSGVEVAIQILSRTVGKNIVIHDVPDQG
ncbi:FAD-dependent oxidoreductase [Thermocrinis minervae]|uniref:Intein N-terminal splicing region n=1 Tax=Thermocrinis minervae TaxID=381751 RepID=A0A1M6SE06_9AQUI|nr:FAD-dependent oxidoreductase [Thermocrinis minervae]SHK42787.1 intein N-terminal splicing region [Thermocrinis minervae]